MLINPTNPNVKIEQADAEAGAKKLGLETVTVNGTNAREIDAALEQSLSAKADAFITATDPICWIGASRLSHSLTGTSFPRWVLFRQFAAVGSLLSYGPSISWMYRQAGEYVGQILKGSNGQKCLFCSRRNSNL